ncbi:MAG: HAD-IA family hydrolase [Pedococcus sp.]
MGLIARDSEPWPALLARSGAGLLLDLDGTLLDSESVHRGAYHQYFAGRGWHVDDQVLEAFSGRRAAEVFATLHGPWEGEDPLALTEGVLAVLRSSTVRPVPVAGAARLLAACRLSGLPFAVVTSARRAWVRATLDLLGVGQEETSMVTAEDCTTGKPDPEPFRRGADLLGLHPEDLVAAEDAPAGIASACAAGVGQVIGMTTSQSARVLLAAGAHTTAPDLVALAGAVERMETR